MRQQPPRLHGLPAPWLCPVCPVLLCVGAALWLSFLSRSKGKELSGPCSGLVSLPLLTVVGWGHDVVLATTDGRVCYLSGS